MAMDSSGVVTSQVARRGRVVVSPPIFFFVSLRRRLFSRWLLLGRFPLQQMLLRCKRSQRRGLLRREQ